MPVQDNRTRNQETGSRNPGGVAEQAAGRPSGRTSSLAPDQLSIREFRRRLDQRIGLDVPPGWWPAAATLKAIEAAGIRWVQLPAPPVEMLADPRHAVRHARALRRSLEVTELCPVLHGPAGLTAGSWVHDRAFEGLLEYAQQIGARMVVHHALDFQRRSVESSDEERSLACHARTAEALGIVLLLENLCPTYPGQWSLCHDPLSVRDLVRRLGSPAVAMAFDVGHAAVVAGFMGVELPTLLEPVLDSVAAFHIHDNLGARLRGEGLPSLDPLMLDLHLPPGAGGVGWEAIRPALLAHHAPLLMEIAPAHRPSPTTLRDIAVSVLGGREAARPGSAS
jgi:sugar phosphate isomerase/epimerase